VIEDAYRLYQGGLLVAAAYGPDSAREIVHYAQVYLSDGPVDIVRRKPNGRWPKAPAPMPHQ
jgi:hypothetical protein